MSIDHGAKVRTKDGHQAGHVKHAIWDPSGKKIIEYVIATGGLLGHDVVVSPELLEGASRDGLPPSAFQFTCYHLKSNRNTRP